jgi:hypothetical protein
MNCSWCNDEDKLGCPICGLELRTAVYDLGREISSMAPLAMWKVCWDLDSDVAEKAAEWGLPIGISEDDSAFAQVTWRQEMRRHAMTFAPAFEEVKYL